LRKRLFVAVQRLVIGGVHLGEGLIHEASAFVWATLNQVQVLGKNMTTFKMPTISITRLST
jgi:hypothetical protein